MLLQPLLSTQTRPYCCRIPLLQVVIPPLEALALSLLLHTGPVLRAPSELDIFTHLFVALRSLPSSAYHSPPPANHASAGGRRQLLERTALRFELRWRPLVRHGSAERALLASERSASKRHKRYPAVPTEVGVLREAEALYRA